MKTKNFEIVETNRELNFFNEIWIMKITRSLLIYRIDDNVHTRICKKKLKSIKKINKWLKKINIIFEKIIRDLQYNWKKFKKNMNFSWSHIIPVHLYIVYIEPAVLKCGFTNFILTSHFWTCDLTFFDIYIK